MLDFSEIKQRAEALWAFIWRYRFISFLLFAAVLRVLSVAVLPLIGKIEPLKEKEPFKSIGYLLLSPILLYAYTYGKLGKYFSKPLT